MSALTYKKAGVDIDEAEVFIKEIEHLIEKTRRPEVLGKIGGFSGLFMPRLKGIKDPVIVSATDGVGTKLLLADALNKYDTVGIDLVAMCADDVIVSGAEPLLFLDYIACGKLNKKKLYSLMKGIARGCQEAGCALVGGETAELPGMYSQDKFDLSGFCTGIVSREKIIDGHLCRKEDKILGLASSGIHSNGFSLVRKIFSHEEMSGKIGKELLKPTRIYTRSILKVMKRIRIKSMAHITGGGFYGNIPRVLPEGLAARIKKGSWHIPPIFRKIQKKGTIAEKEMFRTFNMGIGMVLVSSTRSAEKAVTLFEELGQKAWVIGEIVEGKREVEILS